MNIYVYWNRNDNDCTKMFHFMSENDEYSLMKYLGQEDGFNLYKTEQSFHNRFEYSICDNTGQENHLFIHRIYQPFQDKSEVTESIQENDYIIFMTHGTEDSILKYRNKPERNFSEYILLDKNNAAILKGKVVLAFCCSSVKELGRRCVAPEVGCKAYVGFEKDIVYDNGRAEKSRHIIYESYKKAFMKSLRYAVKYHCTIEEYRIKLMQFMRKEAANAIMKSENQTLHNMYSGTMKGLVALGDDQIAMFSDIPYHID